MRVADRGYPLPGDGRIDDLQRRRDVPAESPAARAPERTDCSGRTSASGHALTNRERAGKDLYTLGD